MSQVCPLCEQGNDTAVAAAAVRIFSRLTRAVLPHKQDDTRYQVPGTSYDVADTSGGAWWSDVFLQRTRYRIIQGASFHRILLLILSDCSSTGQNMTK